MNQLIDEINRMKISQNEANDQFRRKMDDLFVQNSLIQNYNKDLMSKLKEVKYAVKEKEDNPDTINDYLIEQRAITSANENDRKILMGLLISLIPELKNKYFGEKLLSKMEFIYPNFFQKN